MSSATDSPAAPRAHPVAAAPSGRGWRLLAFDTSTSALSVAVGIWEQAGSVAPRVWQHEGEGATQASATLIPTIRRLLAEAGLTLAQLDAIVFGAGPGSFTGLRTACSVAQGLALGADLPVLPVSTLLAVAEDWRGRQSGAAAAPQATVWSVLDARMDELYVAGWRWRPTADGHPAWQAAHDAVLVAPEALLQVDGLAADACCAGNAAPVYGARLPLPVAPAMPTAAALLRLAPALLQHGAAVDPALALPQYVRNKVAQTTAEREAARAAAGRA